MERDARFDDAFIYAVASTGIYCRPSCPARRPRRAQVQFFSSAASAERKGFRPCLRCRPETSARGPEAQIVARLCRAIELQTEEPPRLSALAAAAGMPASRVQRLFQRFTGVTPRGYADAIRLRRLKARLRKGESVTNSLYEAGYGSASRLYERSDAHLGMTPAIYRRGGEGMEISYAVVACPLGRLLVAGTRRGISAVYLGDSDATLESALRHEYPRAQIHRSSAQVSRWVRTLTLHLSGHQPHTDLPLDVRATAFQRRVWETLQEIPPGETRTYSDLARAIGRPKAVRAVARACATNPVSIVIPCHRVVRKDGDLGSYRWGVARKQALLEKERRGKKT
jgi:AraC family transcriptional regulator of adaptative response/methylated-DNA-[protein]-cysteine methyltransferase